LDHDRLLLVIFSGLDVWLCSYVLHIFLVQVSQNCCHHKHDDDCQLYNNDREVGLNSGVLDAAVPHPVLILPTVIPSVEQLHIALQLVPAEGYPQIVPIVPYLEGAGFVLVLVDFEDELGGVGGTLQDAVVRTRAPVQVVLIDALEAGESHLRQVALEVEVVGGVEDPLHPLLALAHPFEVVDGFVEVGCGCGA